MHEKLKFSLGHIMAFVSLIFWGYVTFVGVTYYTGGNYWLGGGVALGITLVLLILLFWLQLLKSVNQNFNRYIIQERIVLVLFTLVCCAAFVPYSHFWTVKNHEGEIVSQFYQSQQFGRQLFSDYEKYANGRLNAVEKEIIALENSNYTSIQLMPYRATAKGLQLQLLPDKYLNLQTDALAWINRSEQTISIWNVFLVGNVDVINSSLIHWHDMMHDMSKHFIDFEQDIDGFTPTVFDQANFVKKSTTDLNSILPYYTTPAFPHPLAWITGIIAILMFYTPWIIQNRSPKSLVTLWRTRKKKPSLILEEKNRIDRTQHKTELEERGQDMKGHHGLQLKPEGQMGKKNHKALTLDQKPENKE